MIVYRFFYAPDVGNWPDGACSGCSMFADTIVHPAHVAARDTTLAFVAAAPMDHIERLRERMGWGHIPFYSLPDDRFSIDFDVEELFGLNVFIRCDGRVYRTYFLNGRGIEDIGSTFSLLDLWADRKSGKTFRRVGRKANHTLGGGFMITMGKLPRPVPVARKADDWGLLRDRLSQIATELRTAAVDHCASAVWQSYLGGRPSRNCHI